MVTFIKRWARASLLLVLVALNPPGSVLAEGLTFAVIPHSTSDGNFIAAYEAAQAEADKHNDHILFLGETGAGQPRYQYQAIVEALNLGVDGIALAPMDVDFLIDNAVPLIQAHQVPLVLFESDFPEQRRHLRAGYVGSDAVEFGRALGRMAKLLKPGGGTVALMRNNPGHESIEKRIRGIRMELGGASKQLDEKLAGGGGWYEHPRTPWEAWDDYDRALSQMIHSLRDSETDVFISAGWWPQMADRYREALEPFRSKLASREKIVIVGDAAPRQLEFLAEGLAHGNVSQDFSAMGQHLYRYLRQLREGQAIPDTTYTPVKTFTLGADAP